MKHKTKKLKISYALLATTKTKSCLYFQVIGAISHFCIIITFFFLIIINYDNNNMLNHLLTILELDFIMLQLQI